MVGTGGSGNNGEGEDAWKTDYEQMMSAMIYGEKPSWDELMQAMKELQERVRSAAVTSL